MHLPLELVGVPHQPFGLAALLGLGSILFLGFFFLLRELHFWGLQIVYVLHLQLLDLVFVLQDDVLLLVFVEVGSEVLSGSFHGLSTFLHCQSLYFVEDSSSLLPFRDL